MFEGKDVDDKVVSIARNDSHLVATEFDDTWLPISFGI